MNRGCAADLSAAMKVVQQPDKCVARRVWAEVQAAKNVAELAESLAINAWSGVATPTQLPYWSMDSECLSSFFPSHLILIINLMWIQEKQQVLRVNGLSPPMAS